MELKESAIFDFPQELAAKIKEGQENGLSDELLIKGMVSIGNLLAHFVKPDTPEEALMQEIWDVADRSEKEMLAKLIIRIGKKKVH